MKFKFAKKATLLVSALALAARIRYTNAESRTAAIPNARADMPVR